jgi:hypothetical protein
VEGHNQVRFPEIIARADDDSLFPGNRGKLEVRRGITDLERHGLSDFKRWQNWLGADSSKKKGGLAAALFIGFSVWLRRL